MTKASLDHILRIKIPIVIFVAIVSFIWTFFLSRAERDGVGNSPAQPVNYSHQLHAGLMRIDCQYCHTAVSRSPHASLPAVSTCMNCHSIARKDKPEIKKIAAHFESGIPIAWKRVHRVPDFAYFNHSVHVNSGIDCSHCHGEVRNMNAAVQVSEFTMSACLDCHRNAPERLNDIPGIKKGPDNCWTCHR